MYEVAKAINTASVQRLQAPRFNDKIGCRLYQAELKQLSFATNIKKTKQKTVSLQHRKIQKVKLHWCDTVFIFIIVLAHLVHELPPMTIGLKSVTPFAEVIRSRPSWPVSQLFHATAVVAGVCVLSGFAELVTGFACCDCGNDSHQMK